MRLLQLSCFYYSKVDMFYLIHFEHAAYLLKMGSAQAPNTDEWGSCSQKISPYNIDSNYRKDM